MWILTNTEEEESLHTEELLGCDLKPPKFLGEVPHPDALAVHPGFVHAVPGRVRRAQVAQSPERSCVTLPDPANPPCWHTLLPRAPALSQGCRSAAFSKLPCVILTGHRWLQGTCSVCLKCDCTDFPNISVCEGYEAELELRCLCCVLVHWVQALLSECQQPLPSSKLMVHQGEPTRTLQYILSLPLLTLAAQQSGNWNSNPVAERQKGSSPSPHTSFCCCPGGGQPTARLREQAEGPREASQSPRCSWRSPWLVAVGSRLGTARLGSMKLLQV